MASGTEDEESRSNGHRFVTWRAYHADQAAQTTVRQAAESSLSERLRKVESVIDQQRGARTLVYFLIGSNLMVIIGLLVALAGLYVR